MMFFAYTKHKIGTSYNFGQPKVGDHTLLTTFPHIPLVRIRLHEDILPLLPITPKHDYKHVGPEILIHNDNIHWHREHSERHHAFPSLWADANDQNYMDKYIEALEKFI